ncbi:MAG: FMN-binding glutamate synthase family protein, partial [Gemmatimonadota bacterium]|nr:FMN-binding glutamate synthase family protein [Gemmatimonadota bacterium]
LRKEITRLSHACGVDHPGFLSADHMEILDGAFGSRPLRDVFGYVAGWELPSDADAALVRAAMGSTGDLGEPAVYAEP